MFKRSFILVCGVVALVFMSAMAAQLWMTRDLPSTFNPGLTIGDAFKQSKVPLLVEFYSDTCGTCKRVSPWVHDLADGRYKNRLTLVMLDVDDAETRSIAELFGVNSLPAIYVFDHRHMKKFPIEPEQSVSKEKLQLAIDSTLKETDKIASLPSSKVIRQ